MVVMIQGHTTCLGKGAASLTNPLPATTSLFLHGLMTKEVVFDTGSLISVLTMSLSVALVKFFALLYLAFPKQMMIPLLMV